jgi:uncharacterized protein YjbI with pentapeptide repeats
MNREELIRKYAGGEKDFTGGDFIRSHWIDDTARGGIYQEAGFSHADLSYADLSGAKNLDRYKNVICYETIMPDGSIYTGHL